MKSLSLTRKVKQNSYIFQIEYILNRILTIFMLRTNKCDCNCKYLKIMRDVSNTHKNFNIIPCNSMTVVAK